MNLKGNHLGELEELVLISVASLPDNAYGVSVQQYILAKAQREVNISAIHEVLKRLERKGYMKSKMGGATNERGGRRKRFFILTSAGSRAMEHAIHMKMQFYKGVSSVSLKLIS
jgi:PadR family transcriptional regulator, regulatory protein PadR